ncbi:MAG: BlaI/MecI/CopY family transcriptional regulator [Planctomycetota bacterium]
MKKRVPETELQILKSLWDSQPSTVRQTVEAVYGEHSQSLHTTVKSLLERLIEKGLVVADRSLRPHTFSSTISREAYANDQVSHIASQLFGGDVVPMLQSLVGQVKLSPEDKATIEEILGELE